MFLRRSQPSNQHDPQSAAYLPMVVMAGAGAGARGLRAGARGLCAGTQPPPLVHPAALCSLRAAQRAVGSVLATGRLLAATHLADADLSGEAMRGSERQ